MNSTLISQLNQGFEDLIKKILNQYGIQNDDVSILFRAPQDFYNNSTVNVFLYDIRENTEMRTQKSYTQSYNRTATDVLMQPNPTYMDFSYIITAWTPESKDENSGNEYDSYDLLSYLIEGLVGYSYIPAEFVRKMVQDKNPLPKLQFFHPLYLNSVSEFWTALKGNPRPVIHCTATIPVYPPVISQTAITEIDTGYDNISISKDEIKKFKEGKSEIKALIVKGNIYLPQTMLAKNVSILVSCNVKTKCDIIIELENDQITVRGGTLIVPAGLMPVNSKHQPITLSKIILEEIVHTSEPVRDPNAHNADEKIIISTTESYEIRDKNLNTSEESGLQPINIALNQEIAEQIYKICELPIKKLDNLGDKIETKGSAVFIICATKTKTGSYKLSNLAAGEYFLEASRTISDNTSDITQVNLKIPDKSNLMLNCNIEFQE